MGIPSVDTYLRNNIDKSLKMILSSPTVMNSILGDLDARSVEDYIKTYSDPKNELPVVFEFPNDKILATGCVQVLLLQGQESKDSIGTAIGDYKFTEGNVAIEQVPVEIDTNVNRMYLEVTQTVGRVETVENITFSSGEPIIVGNRIYFDYIDAAVGGTFIVHYVPTEDPSSSIDIGIAESSNSQSLSGLVKGYTAEEIYGVRSLSNNMDIVRCTDALLKAILITMRNTLEEQYTFSLQHLTYEEMKPMAPYGDDSGQLVYGRQINLSYLVPYSVDVQDVDAITSIIIKGQTDNGNKTQNS